VGAVNANLLSGVQFTLPLTGPERFTEIYFEPEIFAGYGWFFPKDDRVNIGLGMRTSTDAGSPRELLARFKDRFVARGRVEDVVLSRAGGCIPAEPVRSAVHGDVLLAGDAAGHTHPITGAGIFSAVTCGRLAGEYAAEAALGNDPSLLAGYDQEWRDLFGDSLARAASRRTDMESNWSDFIPTVRRTWVAFREYYA
jgi:flavin-dependent dehydrogenase